MLAGARGPGRRAAGERDPRSWRGSARGAETRSAGSDGRLLMAAAVLVAIGIPAMYSATAPLARGETLPPHFVRHVAGIAAGIACAVIASRVPIAHWRALSLPLWAGSLLLLAATLLGNDAVKGAERSLALPGTSVRFQPVELVKFSTLLAMATVLSRRGMVRSRSWRRWWPTGALVLAPAAILLLQPDLGDAVILVATAGLLAFVAGAPLRLFAVPAGALAAGVAAFVAARPYALERVRAFLDPWGTDQGAGFQLVQSFVAFGRGGLWGVGVGDGRQKLFYLPEAHTDFILSMVAEELGMLGALAVIGAFAALLIAGTQITLRARDLFVRLAAFGMTALLTIPALINVAVVTGMLPPTGLCLPFLSYGRSSMIVSFVALGLLYRLCQCEAAPARPKVSAAHRRGSLPR